MLCRLFPHHHTLATIDRGNDADKTLSSKSSEKMLTLHSICLGFILIQLRERKRERRRKHAREREKGDLRSVSNDDTVDEQEDSLFVRGRSSLIV